MEISKSSALSYWYIPKHLRTDERTVGEVTLTRGQKDDTVFIRRIPHGYAAETPLSNKEFPIYFTVGKDKEMDYFTGLRFRIAF